MPIHDWTRVESGIFHAFHTAWIGGIQNALNEGLLPEGYYALAEQHTGQFIADVLALHATPPKTGPRPPLPPDIGSDIALAVAPPEVQLQEFIEPVALTHRRSVAVRHVSNHQLVAILEIVSPANKDREATVEEFADKAATLLSVGVHLLLVDLFPPGLHDPQGMHGAIVQHLQPAQEPSDVPAEAPLTLASYAAGPRIFVQLVHLTVGSSMPDMPLHLNPERYVKVSLEATYGAAYRGMPAFWREVLEQP